ncbi:hypothetical protein FB451DRAFT_1451654 [Mycena latifolia]|nr:hypothetical protein FB451DRAFT_1451654 [Mycena latifolia]
MTNTRIWGDEHESNQAVIYSVRATRTPESRERSRAAARSPSRSVPARESEPRQNGVHWWHRQSAIAPRRMGRLLCPTRRTLAAAPASAPRTPRQQESCFVPRSLGWHRTTTTTASQAETQCPARATSRVRQGGLALHGASGFREQAPRPGAVWGNAGAVCCTGFLHDSAPLLSRSRATALTAQTHVRAVPADTGLDDDIPVQVVPGCVLQRAHTRAYERQLQAHRGGRYTDAVTSAAIYRLAPMHSSAQISRGAKRAAPGGYRHTAAVHTHPNAISEEKTAQVTDCGGLEGNGGFPKIFNETSMSEGICVVSSWTQLALPSSKQRREIAGVSVQWELGVSFQERMLGGRPKTNEAKVPEGECKSTLRWADGGGYKRGGTNEECYMKATHPEIQRVQAGGREAAGVGAGSGQQARHAAHAGINEMAVVLERKPSELQCIAPDAGAGRQRRALAAE